MYVPKIGDRVKLKLFCQYTAKGWNPWTWLVVHDIYLRSDPLDEPYAVRVSLAEDKSGATYTVPLAEIDPPIGWSERYRMEVSTEEAKLIHSWIHSRNGVTVWACLDLSAAGRMMYTPGDRQEKPHWSMGLVEVVTDPARIDLYVIETVLAKPLKRDGFTYDRRCRNWWRAVPYSQENDKCDQQM